MSRTINNTNTLPNMQKIVELAKLLRDKGDKILSASSKLTLSTSLLASLNENFALIIEEPDDIESSFQVCNSSRNEIFRDIKFLHDFVQKTIGLKLMFNKCESQIIDITKFRHLKYLELHKIPISSVKGIQAIRGQLECIICSGGHGVISLEELLAYCGADKGVGFVWGSLTRLALPYNNLSHLDKSLEFVPWVETIDLSHNALTRATDLKYLPNVKNVNLSYNNLEFVPQFNRAAFYLLQKLILRNNYIENINGLEKLEGLVELDLSHNLLTDHSLLWPLLAMPLLRTLCLEGNPLSYHPDHKTMLFSYLHPALGNKNCKLTIDNEEIGKFDRIQISENRSFFLHSRQEKPELRRADITSSSDMNAANTSELENELDVSSVSRINAKKNENIQVAVIADDEVEKDEIKSDSIANSFFETSMDHLEVKRQILALREKYGEDNWLSNHGATCVQTIMGLQSTPTAPLGLFSSTLNDNHLMLHTTIGNSNSTSPSPISKPSSSDETAMQHHEKFEVQVEINHHVSKNDTETEVETINEINTISETEFETSENGIVDLKINEDLTTSYDPEEETGDLFLLQKKRGQEESDEIFLVISSDDIKERDTMTGKILFRWATNTVLSCVLGRGTPTTIDITFDTTRKDRNARTYITNLDDAKKINEKLNEMIRTYVPIVLKIFMCMKCSTQFSQDGDNNIVTSQPALPKCPTCKSTLVIQSDELLSPDKGKLEKIPEKIKTNLPKEEKANEMKLPHSSSQSSIGGSEGMSIITSIVHSDSHPQAQISCSATSLEESRESTPSTGTTTKKYESDIEILSNPSQSSIEILDDGSKSTTPHRKKSLEERRIAVAPSLLTIPDSSIIMAGLTESSSSGSLTDSVCTAYENITSKLMDKNEMSNSKSTLKSEGDADNTLTPVTNLSSMLGELLQSMKIGTTKDIMSRSEETSEFMGNNIQYSYTNFSDIDHRIKLHIILNVFEHENEDIAFLLRADILTHSSNESFPGCLVMSTAKVYILRITGKEGEDPQRWLQKESSWTIDRLRSFSPLPYKQGILVELQQPNKPGEAPINTVLLCILQDFQRTSNFLFYLTNSPLPPSCEVEFIVPQYCNAALKNMLKFCKNYKEEVPIRLLALFSSATLKWSNDSIKLKMSSLIITSSDLIVMQDKINWLLSEKNELPGIVVEQGMSNLIEVEIGGNTLTLNFLDEVIGEDSTWIFEFVSSNAAEAVINSIKPPWEELFSVPLQINAPLMDKSSGSLDHM
ncbi:hypothetical protein TKK_0002453 [Trichogramma kaykai]|uniref:Serine/threonine-protein kinase 11-interacting protein n=1 Tax=Trichogramma kaykai TaxID=54128 RepID=A0ABD2VXH5_9HYME